MVNWEYHNICLQIRFNLLFKRKKVIIDVSYFDQRAIAEGATLQSLQLLHHTGVILHHATE